MEENEYVSDGLDNSDPDESDDDNGEGPKFEKFRKEQLNNGYQVKWGMEFNSLDNFRDAIHECPGSNSDERITLAENDAGTLTREYSTMVSNSRHGRCLKSKKSRSDKLKNPYK
ncbi:hypothetical protein KIW84_064754 [Lathyrus oleraceus]|uniref:Uncharacterized protein n=1 Tax=Pisum sativum TaxID=3888 RepID=A0A9D4WCM7_PEA|nr:hypothetical protein KIW84_064754 [Pisum sativum]